MEIKHVAGAKWKREFLESYVNNFFLLHSKVWSESGTIEYVFI